MLLAFLTLSLPMSFGCAHPIGGPLEDAREARTPPDGFVLEYVVRSGPLGGRDVILRSDGRLLERRWRPGFVPTSETPENSLGHEWDTESQSVPDDSDTDADSEERPHSPREGAVEQSGTVAAEDVLRVVDVVVAIEGWEEVSGDDLPSDPVEAGKVTLSLRIGDETTSVWEWARDLEANDRLIRVRRVLDQLVGTLGEERR